MYTLNGREGEQNGREGEQPIQNLSQLGQSPDLFHHVLGYVHLTNKFNFRNKSTSLYAQHVFKEKIILVTLFTCMGNPELINRSVFYL